MPAIAGSVGQGGLNRRTDVSTVQELLNRIGANLIVDGSCGPKTIIAIKKFQSSFLPVPDGRIDPYGMTFNRLVNTTGSGRPATPLPTEAASVSNLPPKLNAHTFDTFVSKTHDVKFKDVPNTRNLIKAIMPYYPKEVTVIGGYLDESDQYWKVNYHWELLLSKINKALSVVTNASNRTKIENLRKVLITNPPNPQTGYMASKTIGFPKDMCSAELIKQRHGTLKSCKEEFKPLILAEGLSTKYPDGPMWDLAVAPVASPGQSTHGKGYALDIFGTGLNSKIKEISKALGATLTFDEKSHMHVEFANGVKPGA